MDGDGGMCSTGLQEAEAEVRQYKNENLQLEAEYENSPGTERTEAGCVTQPRYPFGA